MSAKLRSFWRKLCAPWGGIDSQSLFFQLYHEGEFARQKIHHSEFVTWMAKGEFHMFKEEIVLINVFREGGKDQRLSHAFVVFSTENYFFSIERLYYGILLQCSTNIEDVVNRRNGISRDDYHLESGLTLGQDSVWDMLRVMLTKKIFKEKYNYFTRNCQVFAALVFKHFNAEGKTFQKYQIIQ